MGRPSDSPHRIFVSVQFGERGPGIPQIPSSDDSINASGGEELRSVFIPVLGEHFHLAYSRLDDFRGLALAGAKIKDAAETIAGNAGDDGWAAGLP